MTETTDTETNSHPEAASVPEEGALAFRPSWSATVVIAARGEIGEDPRSWIRDAFAADGLRVIFVENASAIAELSAKAGEQAAAAERGRIKGLFDEWITILMSEPNAHPPEAWIAGFADLIAPKPEGAPT